MRRACAEFFAKAEYAFDYGMPQWLARLNRLFSALHFERLFLGRQKFCHFRTWYRHQLGSYIEDVMLDPRTLSRPYLNKAAIEPMVSAHLAGRGNFTVAIHKILSIELTQRLLLEQA
jgi:asparagine synthase (glutamine-hydrolysing)